MKKLWRRATGKIKDRNSILMLNILSRNSTYRQPDLESAMIKATSHDDSYIDYKNARRVFTWVQTSPTHLMVFLWALTRRTKRTQNWVVALKSLILLHGVLCTKAPGTRKIGRLPFDLSSFEDGQSGEGPRGRTRSQFVQAYYAFCDMKSVILSAELRDEVAESLTEEAEREKGEARAVLVRVQRWQELLDAVLEVRPIGGGTGNDVAVLEAMDCMVVEVFDLYSKICDGIAKGLMTIYKVKADDKHVASMALDILHKASRQGRHLSDYFHFCTNIGILHLTECPKIQQIPEDDFFELKKIINGDTQGEVEVEVEVEDDQNNMKGALVVVNDVVVQNQGQNKSWLKTVISDKWETFDEEVINKKGKGRMVVRDPFEASLNFPPVMQFNNSLMPSSQDRLLLL